MSDKQLATYMIEYVGGKNNIKNVVHCITRVRFYLVDKERADTNKIKELDGVMGVVEAQGQYQVVVGNKVNAIYEEVMRQLNNDQAFDSTEGVVENDSNSDFLQLFRNGFNQFIGIITGSMMPVIGLLAGAGIIKGLQASLVTFDLLQDSSQSYLLINTIADGIFYFLPVILGFTAAQKLKVNPIVLAVVGAILIHPNIVTIASSTAAKVAIFGIEFPIMNYTASVFPILVAAWLATYVEKFLKKIVPLVISSIVSPIVEVLVLSLAVLLIIGPIITIISDGLAFGISTIFDFNTIIGGAVYCALFPVLVVFGMHWPLIPIIVNDLTVNGFSMMNAFSSVLMMGIAGATCSIALKTKKAQLKQVAFAATLSQICGVGEPAIYGILLKYKKVFYLVTLSNIFGGALAGFLHLVNYGFAGGVIGFASFINPVAGIDNNFYAYLLSHIGTFLLSFLLTWLFGFNDKMNAADEL